MKIRYIIILTILIAYSCSKDEETQVVKTGHFLIRITSNGETEEVYNYDDNGNLTSIDKYSPIYEEGKFYRLGYEYYSNGLVKRMNQINTNGELVRYECYEYNSQGRIAKRIVYTYNNTTSKFEANATSVFKYVENRIEVELYNYGIKSPVYYEYVYDWSGRNITEMRSYVYGSMTNFNLYAYDDQKNPYYDLKLPLPTNCHNIFRDATYFSKNNVIRVTSQVIKPDSAIIDTTFSETDEYHYLYDSLNYPNILDLGNSNRLNFEYIDIK